MDEHQQDAVNQYFVRLDLAKQAIIDKDNADEAARIARNQNIAATQKDPETNPNDIDRMVDEFLESHDSAASGSFAPEPCAAHLSLRQTHRVPRTNIGQTQKTQSQNERSATNATLPGQHTTTRK